MIIYKKNSYQDKKKIFLRDPLVYAGHCQRLLILEKVLLKLNFIQETTISFTHSFE